MTEIEELRQQLQATRDLPARDLPRLVVCAVIIDNDHVLLERRAPSGVVGLDNMWDLPGGKVELNETPEQGIVREIAEELGVIIKPLRLIPYLPISHWTYADGQTRHWVLAAYRCELVTGHVQTRIGLDWFHLNALPSNLLKADRELITLAMGS